MDNTDIIDNTVKEFVIKDPNIDFESNYNEDFKEVDSIILERLNEENGKGLVMLYGNPGTGKTSYIRRIINNVKKRVLYLPPDMATELSNPGLVPFLTDIPNSLLIVEDAENVLLKRQGQHNQAISNILNLSEVSVANIQNFTDKSYEYDLLQTSDGEYIETSFGDFLSVAKTQEYNLKSKKEIGGYFVPDKCGVSVFVDNNISWEIDWDNSESGKFYSYPNPNIYANSITTGLNQSEIPLIFYHSYDWILQSKAGELNGKIKNENKDQLFDGYQSSSENLQRNSLGLNCRDEILFLGESSSESPWLSADFISPDTDSVDYTWVIIPAMRQYPYLSNIPALEVIAETGHNVFKWIKNNKQKQR